MAGLAMRATARRWRGLGVGVRLGCGGFGRWAGGLTQQEKVPQVAQRLAARGMPSAVIADLVEAGRQDVLEEAPDELVAGDGFLALAVGGAVLVAIGHGLVVDGQDAGVGDGDAEGVAGEIVAPVDPHCSQTCRLAAATVMIRPPTVPNDSWITNG